MCRQLLQTSVRRPTADSYPAMAAIPMSEGKDTRTYGRGCTLMTKRKSEVVAKAMELTQTKTRRVRAQEN